MYVYIRLNPSDQNIIDGVRLEIYLHREKYLRNIKDPDQFRVEFFTFFKQTCEDIRKEHRPSNSSLFFLKKIASEVWDEIYEIQAIVNVKKFSRDKIGKRIVRNEKALSRQKAIKDFLKKSKIKKKTKVDIEIERQKQLKLF